jgi:hypothetical protein
LTSGGSQNSLDKVIGAYAIVIMDRMNLTTLAAKNCDSSGVGGEYFIASDASPIII